MTYIISLNEINNVEKTIQINLLLSHYIISKVEELHNCEKKIGEMYRRRLLQKWWWKSFDQNFVCFIFDALARRHQDSMIDEHSVFIVFDRDIFMFETVAVAIIAIKRLDRDLNKTRTTLHTILKENHLQASKEILIILLRHGDSLKKSL